MTVLADIYDVITPAKGYGNMDLKYFDSMMHAVPEAGVVKERERFILQRCAGKRVVNFGSESGLLHDAIKKIAKEAFGVDKEGEPDFRIDLDDEFYNLYILPIADIFVCGELLEHLSNPGSFLRRLKIVMNREPSDLIITVPNAFCEIAQIHMRRGYENVNADHVAWYTWRTLKTLVERMGFKIKEFYFYGPGKPGFTEGLIFVVS